MNELAIFENPEFGKVRTVEYNGKPYVVGNDIATALEYSRPYEAVTEHCKGAVSYRVIDSVGRMQDTRIIPEGDIYRLIVKAADQSRNKEIKAKAERYEKWIFEEVLPSIRRTGSYSIQPKSQVEALLESVQLLAAQEKRLAQLEGKTTTIEHRVNSLDLTNIEGTLRQRLVKMVQRYANQKGITYSVAWHDFTSAFNTAYHTNLKSRIGYYGKKISTPEYLEEVGEVEDGIRVADKMLNEFSIQ
jgi:prophage antirepressor-like protein